MDWFAGSQRIPACMEHTNFYFNDTCYPACYRSNTHTTTVSVRGMEYIPVFGTYIGLGGHGWEGPKAVDLRNFVMSVGGVSQETAPKPAQECRNRSENRRNRKITFFYIETVLNFFFQFQKIKFSAKNQNFQNQYFEIFGSRK